MDFIKVQEAHDNLRKVLSNELNQVIEVLLSGDPSLVVEMPHRFDVDTPMQDMMTQVAVTSNVYGRLTRLAGIARAQYKLAKGDYDRKYKTNKVGKNEAERERSAMQASAEEHVYLNTLEAIIELAESQEQRARIASESSRKILGAQQTMYSAHLGERKGSYSSS